VSTEANASRESLAEAKNKALVREAFDALFNRRDYGLAETYWSPYYVQHSAHIPPGRDGLFNLVRALPDTLRHETELVMADGDLVMVRGRFSGHGQPAPWIVVDTVRVRGGVLVEHWDVVEDEASREDSVSGLPMFGDTFPGDP
jgi:predicted SnoaL-like aldol condensation-catalyzing enzyme